MTRPAMFTAAERLSTERWLPPWVRAQHQARFKWAARQMRARVVTDVACGEGEGARTMAAAGARRVDGFDLSHAALGAARRADSDARLSFCVADATRLPVAARSYDAVVSFETIEHIADDRAFLAEVARVLRPGGHLLCSTPNRRLLDPGTTILDRPFNPFHVREYTRCELDPLLREFFDTVEWLGQSPYPRAYVSLLHLVGRAAPRVAVKLHQARKLLGLPFDGARRHEPAAVRDGFEPEILIAVCQR